MKVLVTGGAGFMGSHVVDEALKLGFEVVTLDDLSGGFRENLNPKAKFIKGSVNNVGLINKLFKKYRFSYVYHLAAYAAEGLSHFIKKFNYENNLIGSINLINASVNHGVKCFVFTSSIAVYGKNQLPMREAMQPLPEDSYGISKYAVELELKTSHEIFGLDYIIFRPHNVYGEKQNIGDKYRNVIGIFMNQLMQNKPLSVFGNGKQTRAFSYIGDVAPVIAKSPLVKKAYNQVFNIGADKPYTINQLTKAVSREMGIKPEITYFPARNEVIHAYSDHRKVSKYFSLRNRVSLSEGIRRMAGWAKKAGAKQSKKFKNIEIEKNLPSAWLK
ncbi:MAG: NAD-dependent epimerase/dehydratase family protein [Elusimicrobia bacterium]|nr:NAD-dependent epimerase/dehydratase family protein [Candidatus Liberimonas magnetica]